MRGEAAFAFEQLNLDAGLVVRASYEGSLDLERKRRIAGDDRDIFCMQCLKVDAFNAEAMRIHVHDPKLRSVGINVPLCKQVPGVDRRPACDGFIRIDSQGTWTKNP